jgi:hypothetical protein
MTKSTIEAAKTFLTDNGFSGWTQATNGKFFLEVLEKLIAQKASHDVLVSVMTTAGNASANRQTLERASVIEKSQGGRKTSVDILAQFKLD